MSSIDSPRNPLAYKNAEFSKATMRARCASLPNTSRIPLKNKGLMNVYGDLASGCFLGAEMPAPAAELWRACFSGI